MEKIQSKIPTLRFNEFSEDWNILRLDEVTISIMSGKTKASSQGKFPVYGSTGIIGRCKRYTHDGKFLLVARVGANAGTINFVNGQFSVTDNTLIIDTGSSVDIHFTHLSMLKFNLNKLIFGSGQPLITGGQLKALKIYFPTLLEQQKIALFLTAVDDKIQQLTKKKELLGKYKKGVMQKLFPSKDGQAPEIRFKDDEGNDYPDWEFLKGRELFKSHSNKNHNGDLPILAATQENGMILRDETGLKIQSSEASIKSYKVVEKGDFVISLRSFQGGIEYSAIKGICSPAYTILKPKIKIDEHFFRFYFKKDEFIERLSKTVVGIRDGKQISYDAFSWLKLPYPIIEEQQKIADFLSSIDKKINSVNTQLEKTKEFKKGLLQQMFV